ncbi:hypothetical protein DXV75_16425 [Alteromonas aestuariivivens]|uniref:Uncharacterized protein n=1 Tax=Alteromonas aestuariivivens TaxID=1938339 RepID=A0A3D8M2X0_9ALTE|nr:capsule biosynthesis GfcC family protein [Alteromonas aestuariivivens]RDV23950.1 hypothetical protein DXV75_16425 [Alteromonas aestuariivivens]
MKKVTMTLCMASLAMLSSSVLAGVRVQLNQQAYQYAGPVRMEQLLAPVAQQQNWYWPASALYVIDSEQPEALRNEILQELDQLVIELAPQSEKAVSLRMLRQQIESWHLARRVKINIHYDRARLDPKHNPMVTDGDYLLKLSERPAQIYLSGQVFEPGAYEFQPASVPFNYTEGVKTRFDAETDYVFVIEPSGAINKVGIAYWNREWQPLIPGSQIFVPISSSLFSPSTQVLNQKIAELAVHRVLP